jgi:uncharacterized protein (TIGR02678 family)
MIRLVATSRTALISSRQVSRSRKSQQWHSEHTGWHIEYRGGLFRLLRQPDILPSNFGKNKLQEARDFACLVWALSYAASRQMTGYGGEQQFLLSHLIQYIVEQSLSARSSEGLDFEKKSNRYSMMRALKYLRDIGGLQLVEGQEQEWIDRRTEVLYEFTDVASLFITALDLEAVATVAHHRCNNSPLQPALIAVSGPPLMRAWRILLVEPVFLRYDDPEGFAELNKYAEGVARTVTESFGWLLEVNRDYACIVRSSGAPADNVPLLHLGSAIDQIVALLCRVFKDEFAAQHLISDTYGCVKVPLSEIEYLFTTSIRPHYGQKWGKEAQETPATTLLKEALKKMRQAGLLRGPDNAGDVLLLPLATRFDAMYSEPEQDLPQRTKSKRSQKHFADENESLAPDLWSHEETE